ncbi:MAG: TRAP transporter substrate-binding protein [Pseudomonadota bacterium]
MVAKTLTNLFGGAVLATAIATSGATAQSYEETEINYVGTWGNLSLYNKVEKPFWGEGLSEASDGAIKVNIQPFTEMGLQGDEILRLLRNGVLEVSATLLSYVAGEIPEAEAVDLAGITRDIDQAHAVTDAYRPVLQAAFRDRLGVELLAIIPYHAQIAYCREPITQIQDFKGLKVRASGRSQGDMIEALGGTAIGMAFGEVVPALERGVVDCAITGALSGNLARWHQATNYLYPLPISWAITFVAANGEFWDGLDPAVRELMIAELEVWEDSAWESGRSETSEGVSCNTGGECADGNVAGMTLVPVQDSDYEVIRQIMNDVVVPKWAERCGSDCAISWNETAGAVLDLTAPTD